MAQINSTEVDGLNLPYSLEAEQSVLGAILLDGNLFGGVYEIIKPEYFHITLHKEIFSAMVRMYTTGGFIDFVTVLEELKSSQQFDEIDTKNYLLQLVELVPSTANVEAYAKIVREKYYVRTLIEAARKIIEDAIEGQADADLLLDSAEQRIYDIRRGRDSGGLRRIDSVILETYDRLEKLNSPERELYEGIPTGFKAIDSVTTGLNKSDLIVLASRPGMGKTSFSLNIAQHVGQKLKKPVAFFSLEMTREQLVTRMLSYEASLSNETLRRGDLTPEEWTRLAAAAERLAKAEIYFDETAGISVPEIKARVRRMKNVELVIIDYLGLIAPTNPRENRVQQISEMTRNLKIMAKDLQVPIIVLSQLSREPERRSRSERKPTLSDLRDSGSIEQDADIVMFLYRSDYYSDRDADIDEEVDHNAAECIIAKNRHGRTANIPLHWQGEYTRFTSKDIVHSE